MVFSAVVSNTRWCGGGGEGRVDSAQTAVQRINAAQILGGENTVVSTAVYEISRKFWKQLEEVPSCVFTLHLGLYYKMKTLSHYAI